MFKKSSKVLVAMSGGVDSSVAALLLKQEGYDVIGASMHLYSCNRPAAKSCCSAKDRLDARRVCERLGIPFISLDYREKFRVRVIEPFLDEYQNGRTPSPCILCNRHMKFDALFAEALKLGADAIATGHYARVETVILRAESRSKCRLLRGVDKKKDQSYFLFTLSQGQLSKILFPVGHLTKDEVRKIARKHGLPTSEKKESQEICFVPDNNYASFVEQARPLEIKGPGNFVDTNGNVVGRHRGIHNYTIGQRRGLGFGVGSRQYVVRIDAENNQIILGSNDDLLRSEMVVKNVNWIGGGVRLSSPKGKCRTPPPVGNLGVQIRSTHAAADAFIEMPPVTSLRACRALKTLSARRAKQSHEIASPPSADRNDFLGKYNSVKVIFEKPQRAIAPGQAAVFYNGDEVLGGGWIE